MADGDEPVPEEHMYQEFEMIQNIIDRQASNSFKIKGWTVTLVVVALLFRTSNFQLFGAVLPLIGFWGLDAFYLRQECKYRELYNWVRLNRPDSREHLFDLDASRFDDEIKPFTRMMFSTTLVLFYGMIALLLIGFSIVTIQTNGGLTLG
ncbi:hypothetical protein ACH9L7_14875 [Haloferax sp. S1W]|uniref:hypothetical protein n=1 Tax=Haloferax sp. S1W TaxID=3377110 RepID=UPI0037CABC78